MSPVRALRERLAATSSIGAWLLVLAWALVILVLLLQPDAEAVGGRRLRIQAATVGHAAFFTVLGFLAANAVIPLRVPRALWWVVVGVTLYGILGEVVQAAVPGRSPSIVDLGADVVGAIVGALAWTVLARWYSGAAPRRAVRFHIRPAPHRPPHVRPGQTAPGR